MKRLRQIEGKLTFLLFLTVSVLCAGFFIASCGNKPQNKATNNNKGAYAIDFSRCPAGRDCVGAAHGNTITPVPDLTSNTVTLEAWIKASTTATTGTIFKRSDGNNGLELTVENNVPQLILRRAPASGDVPLAQRTPLSECVQLHSTSTECIVQALTSIGSTSNVAAVFTIPGSATVTTTISSAFSIVSTNSTTFVPAVTSTVTQIVIGSAADAVTLAAGNYTSTADPNPSTTFNATVIATTAPVTKPLEQNSWTHIAGVVTTEDQSTGPNNCAVDVDGNGTLQGAEQPHLAIYIDGVLNNCATTNGLYAGNPAGDENISIGSLNDAVIDELRIWITARSVAEIAACKDKELGIRGECRRDNNPNLAAYYRFNEGEGALISDFSGNGFSGGLEYALGNQVFAEWEDGWVTPGAPITPAD